jgi:sugar/nucleoside kinase (ribokinase family)
MKDELCCIGHITMDKVVTPAGTVLMPGGTSYYFAQAVAALDVSFRLVTSLATDNLSAAKTLEERRVDVTGFPSSRTHFFENIYGADTDHRTQRVLQQADPFTPEQLAGVNASIIHLGPLLAGDFSGTIIKQLAVHSRLSLDVQGFLRRVENYSVVPADWTDKKELIPFVYFLKANEEELAVLTGQNNIEKGAAQLLQWGAKEVIVTLGSKGSVIFTRHDSFVIPAFPPRQLIDATGCGDTYMAGYLYKRSKGAGIAEGGYFAAAMATLKLEHSGPFMGTGANVELFCSKQKIV